METGAQPFADREAARIQLEAISVSRRYGAVKALDDLSLSVRQGEFLTLLGPSGSGKSTFLNILAGFDTPSQGRLMQGDLDVTHCSAEKRNFGMVFQGYALFPHLSVEHNVAFPLRVRKIPVHERARRVGAALASVGLSAHAGKYPKQLSGGQQQRVALARALVFWPDILLLDEPLSALDKSLREQLQIELKRIHREVGTTFIFVTHDQSEALALSDRIAIFNQGRLMQIGTPEAVYMRPSSRFVAEFLGKINVFPVSQALSDGKVTSGRFGDRTLLVHGTDVGEVLIGVRPEHMVMAHAPADGMNSVAGTIYVASYQGSVMEIGIAAQSSKGAHQFSISLPTEKWHAANKQIGDLVWLNWPPQAGLVLPAL